MTEPISKLQDAVTSTLQILDDKKDKTIFNNDVEVIGRSVKQIAWKAKRLNESTARNAAVSVYGPSQVGKSFLASVLVRPDDGYLKIAFPSPTGNKTYIGEINPGGDQECTGIVTRFTITQDVGKPDFPVYLRLLNEIDLVCILCNSYFSEGDQRYETHKSSEEINDFLVSFVCNGQNTHLSQEDFWELEEYLREHFSSFEYTKVILPFVERIGAKALEATVEQRVQIYSTLWGFHKPFTNLFRKLLQVLEELQHASEIFAEISSLIPKSSSIIDVRLLSEIYNENDDFIRVSDCDGNLFEIQRGQLSALTAELVLTVHGIPHDFFNHTDVLDFPGTRNRKAENLNVIFEDSEKYLNIHQFFLRGKVAYLFDKYVNSQDINSMLLCIKDSNMEAVGLPAMVEKWVHNSIGKTSEARKGKTNNLFFVLTYFDKHLSDTTANRHETDRFKRRLHSSLLEMFGNHENTWVKNWSGNQMAPQTFKNCYLLRNPGVEQSYFEIDQKTGIEKYCATSEQETRLAEIKKMFISTKEIDDHFLSPETAWESVMKPNDGGTSYILENLASISGPDTKINQLNSLAQSLSEDLHGLLTQYYTPTDSDEKKRVAQKKFDDFKYQILNEAKIVKNRRFSTFLELISVVDEDFFAALDTNNKHDICEYIGDASKIWQDKVKLSISHISKELNLGKSCLEFLFHEISTSMQVRKLNQQIHDTIKFLNDFGVSRGTRTKAHEICADLINSFICDVDENHLSDTSNIVLNLERPNIQEIYSERWLKRLWEKIEENISSEGGVKINAEANAKLSKILKELGVVNG